MRIVQRQSSDQSRGQCLVDEFSTEEVPYLPEVMMIQKCDKVNFKTVITATQMLNI